MLIDYMGYRLVCMALLPLKESALIYGSDDGGKTVKNEDEEFSKAMNVAGAELYLAKHRVHDVVRLRFLEDLGIYVRRET